MSFAIFTNAGKSGIIENVTSAVQYSECYIRIISRR
nr:MAG TPA: hypothetical protein [Caudoviricetes sp.]